MALTIQGVYRKIFFDGSKIVELIGKNQTLKEFYENEQLFTAIGLLKDALAENRKVLDMTSKNFLDLLTGYLINERKKFFRDPSTCIYQEVSKIRDQFEVALKPFKEEYARI